MAHLQWPILAFSKKGAKTGSRHGQGQPGGCGGAADLCSEFRKEFLFPTEKSPFSTAPANRRGHTKVGPRPYEGGAAAGSILQQWRALWARNGLPVGGFHRTPGAQPVTAASAACTRRRSSRASSLRLAALHGHGSNDVAKEARHSPRDDPVIVRWVGLCARLGSVCQNGVIVYVDRIFDCSGPIGSY